MSPHLPAIAPPAAPPQHPPVHQPPPPDPPPHPPPPHSISPLQFGFRAGRGCPDAIHTLRRLHELATREQTPLYAAYIDLKKAFDCVNRAALWQVLALRGAHPSLISHIKDLYTDSTAVVRVGTTLSYPFPLATGVRQGCPMSPLLFNVFMDVVATSLQRQLAPDHGISIAYTINGRLHFSQRSPTSTPLSIPFLLYADDMVLLATSAAALEAMLRCLESVCADLGMSMNYTKTKLQGLGRTPAPPPTIHLAGGSVDAVGAFKYLGNIISSLVPATKWTRRSTVASMLLQHNSTS